MLIACLLLIILAACGAASSGGSAPTPSTAPNPAAPPITLVLWHAWPSPEQRTLAVLVDRYNRSNRLVRIILQAKSIATLTSELRGAALEGSGPHLILVQSHTLGALAQEGLLLPLDDLVSAVEREQLLPSALGGAQAQDVRGELHLYGLPITFDTLALYYNRANVLNPPANTATLLDSARGLTQPPIWGFAYTLSLDRTIGYLYAFGGRIFDDQGNLVLGTEGRLGTERWLEWLLTLRQDQQLLAGTDSIAIDRALKAQQVLMAIDWAHALPTYRDLWKENLGVAILPRLSEEDRFPQPYVQSDVISINARVMDTAEQRAALDFARYLLNEEAQNELLQAGKQPTMLGLSLTGNTPHEEAARVFRAQAQQSLPMPNSRAANEIVKDILERMQVSVLRGLATPADAVTRADTLLRERLGLPPAP